LDLLWLALGIALIFEGLLPFAAPAAWRRMLLQMQHLSDAQLRLYGLALLAVGVVLLWSLS
jgi:uncharacterized protein